MSRQKVGILTFPRFEEEPEFMKNAGWQHNENTVEISDMTFCKDTVSLIMGSHHQKNTIFPFLPGSHAYE